MPGGCVALLRAVKVLQQPKVEGDEQLGVNIITRAIEEPMRWIATNAGHEGSIVVQKVQDMKDEEGFNAQTETYENLVRAGVIDPAKVVRSALQHAASIASLLLTTEAVITQIPEENKHAAMPGGGMGEACTEKFSHHRCRAPVSRWTARVHSDEGITLADGFPQEKHLTTSDPRARHSQGVESLVSHARHPARPPKQGEWGRADGVRGAGATTVGGSQDRTP